MSEPVVGSDGAVDVVDAARQAVAAAVVARPELADVERLLAQLLDGSVSPAEEALTRLLDGLGTDHDADLLGVPLAGARIVVARFADTRARAALSGQLTADGDVLAVSRGDAVVALARNVPHRAGDDKGLRTARRLALFAIRHAPEVRVGISGPLTDVGDIARAAHDAIDAADLTAPGEWVCIDDVWGDVVIARLRRLLPDCLTSTHPLSRLVEHDRKRGCDFAPTVARWLARQQDTLAAATDLCLHPNTLRYRLRRAQELSGLDLSDPAQALIAYLGLSV